VDYRRPVESLIPGVSGRVLGVLAKASTELTMRAVAELADVSPQQASVVIGKLVELGVVDRRDVGPASLVRLDPQNLAAQTVLSIAALHRSGLEHLTKLASAIVPPPASLVVYGSFARGEAGPDSDVDILVVRPAGVPADSDVWTDSLGQWVDRASRALGNPVNLVEVAAEELPSLLGRAGSSVWHYAAREGIVLAGSPLPELTPAA
jgi:predicted nucleotidyltransferase